MIARHLPVLAAAMTHVAHLAIRNRGTIGGSLSHADPAAELPMMALLLDAELRIVVGRGHGARSRRATSSVGALTVDLAEDEIVTEIVLPKLPPGTGWGFEEVARRSGDFALAAVGGDADARRWRDRAGPHRHDRRRRRPPRRAAEAEALLIGTRARRRRLIDARHRSGARRRRAERPTCTPRRTIGAISSACWPAGRSPPPGAARGSAA